MQATRRAALQALPCPSPSHPWKQRLLKAPASSRAAVTAVAYQDQGQRLRGRQQPQSYCWRHLLLLLASLVSALEGGRAEHAAQQQLRHQEKKRHPKQ